MTSPAEDKEISATLRKILTKRGIDILASTSLENIQINNGVSVEVKENLTHLSLHRKWKQRIFKCGLLTSCIGQNTSLSKYRNRKNVINF